MMMLWPVILGLLMLVESGCTSWGDQSPHFRQCSVDCFNANCSTDSALVKWKNRQSVAEQLLWWSCKDDCKYICMWKTVDVYSEHGRVPQFYGKWPFIRILGVQEPASVFASIINLATNLGMLVWFMNNAPSDPSAMYWVWVGYGLTAVNAWVWSSVFHTRDNILTERLDYFSALATVSFSFLTFCLRTIGPDSFKSVAVISMFVAFYSHHVYHMAFVHFDYGYNMKVNVAVGVINGVGWLIWFALHRNDGRHIMKGVMAVMLVGGSVALELLDFPPIYWVLDSHAIWHFATIPMPLLWFQFALGDVQLLSKTKMLKTD